MRLAPQAPWPLLAGCAVLVVASCSTDERQTDPGLAPNISPAVTATSAYDIVKVPSITVDGNLDDWVNIAAISMADDPANGRGALNNSAKVKLAWDDTYLYAAYDVTDTDVQAVQTARDHIALSHDDEVELYVDPQGDGAGVPKMTATDYQFLANVVETEGDLRGNGSGGKDSTYNAPSFVAKAVASGTPNAPGADVGYVVELQIAWADLGVTPAAGNFMRIDPAVGDRDGDPPPENAAEFDWAGLSNFNNPDGWKEVQLTSSGSAPGGTIGVAPRNGEIIDISGDSHRTTQYWAQTENGGTGFKPGQRIEAGIGASRTTWRNDGAGDPQQRNTLVRDLGYPGVDNWSFHGGRVLGDSPEDGSWPWNSDNLHDFHAQKSLSVGGGKNGLIEHFAARNNGDGISFTFGALDSKDGGVVRWCALEDMGDNPISNDTKHAITIYQNYISGVSFYESRPQETDSAETYDASHKTVTFDGNVMRLKPKRYSDMKPWNSGSFGDPVVFSMFKLQVTHPAFNTMIAFHNNVLRYDGIDGEDQAARVSGNGVILGTGFASRVSSQSNNVMLFPNRSSGLPHGWPTTGLGSFTYLYGNAAKARWNQEMRNWMAAHPEVPVSDPGLFPGF